MGFLQDLAKRAETALAGLSQKSEEKVSSVTISYLGQTASIPMTDLPENAAVQDVIDTIGADVGLGDVNQSALGVRRDGTVVGHSDKATEGTYFLTLAREEKAGS